MRELFLIELVEQVMFSGKITSISADKGFGFIQPHSGGADVFFHRSAVDADFTSLSIGQRVQYEPDKSAAKPRAKSVLTTAVQPNIRRSPSTSLARDFKAKPRLRDTRVYEFGFVTRLRRRKREGFISSNKGGPEYLFAASAVTGEKPYSELTVGDYVKFVPRGHQVNAKQPIVELVTVTDNPVLSENYTPVRHPRSRGKKPTWR